MSVVALVYSFYFQTPKGNCYEWLLGQLMPGSKLRPMAGKEEVVDFTVNLKMAPSGELGRAFYLEVDSNQGEREIHARDYTDEDTRTILRCHHVLTDIRATTALRGHEDLLSAVMEMEEGLCSWIDVDVLPVIEYLSKRMTSTDKRA